MVKVRDNVKKGMTVLLIYTLITICLLLSTKRIERLDSVNKGDFRNNNTSVSINFKN